MRESTYVSKEYKGIVEILNIFMDELPDPDAVCLAVAGPILDGKAVLTNLHWEIDQQEITRRFGTGNIFLINDLEANAYGLAMLDEKDLSVIHHVSAVSGGNAAIIAPGTGLGEAGLYWDGKYYHPFATEGGHSDFAPRNETGFELLCYLQKKFGHISWERLVCGPGIFNIYQFLKDEKKIEEPGWLKEKMNTGDAASVISEHAGSSPLCDETMKYFFRFLAQESANLVLKLKATGGLFIGGGISPKLAPMFARYNFYSSYCDSGRLNFLLEKVPVKLILNNKAALLGAAFYAYENYRST
jgi:glucokinase